MQRGFAHNRTAELLCAASGGTAGKPPAAARPCPAPLPYAVTPPAGEMGQPPLPPEKNISFEHILKLDPLRIDVGPVGALRSLSHESAAERFACPFPPQMAPAPANKKTTNKNATRALRGQGANQKGMLAVDNSHKQMYMSGAFGRRPWLNRLSPFKTMFCGASNKP